jgi:hypothetical protein
MRLSTYVPSAVRLDVSALPETQPVVSSGPEEKIRDES